MRFQSKIALHGRPFFHQGLAAQPKAVSLPFEQFDLQIETIARNHLAPKFQTLDPHHPKAAAQKNPGQLQQTFDLQDPGHDGKVREMTAKVGLVDGHVLVAGGSSFVKLQDPVQEQARITMGQPLPDFVHLQHQSGPP